jgi:hypothetical protein
MANVDFSGLTALTSLAVGDLFCVTDVSEGVVEKSKNITLATLRDYLMITGSYVRPQFTWSSATVLKVGAGFYDCDGKYSYWVSELSETLAGLAAATRYYVYLDYSAITSGTAITATEIIVSSTAPTYSHSKVGWYNGSDRCIFSFLTEAASTSMREFVHVGEKVIYANQITERARAVLSSASGWTDVDMASAIPAFCRAADVTFDLYGPQNVDPPSPVYWRTNGQTGTTGHLIGRLDKDNSVETIDYFPCTVTTDSGQIIEIQFTSGATQQIGVYVDGWRFPIGM